MKRAIELASKALGNTATNPLVGCVIVHEGRIIGEGFHKKFGGAHAEVEAVASVKKEDSELLVNSTLYVTLEPCCHFGKTAPCTELIIENRIPKVVIACQDPFEKVAGKGIERLRNAGVEVEVGVLESEARQMNRRFFVNQILQRPYIVLKWAQSADGFMASQNGNKVQISGKQAQLLLHKWRSEEDAFAIGKNTLEQDNPLLNNRLWQGKSPTRVLFGDANSKNLHSPFFENEGRILVCGKTDSNKLSPNIEVINTYPKDLEKVLFELKNKGISSLVVEGGRKLLDSFIEKELFDEVRIFRSKKVELLDGIEAPDFIQTEAQSLDLPDDVLSISYHNRI